MGEFSPDAALSTELYPSECDEFNQARKLGFVEYLSFMAAIE
ncbi:MAG: hypothetical protein ACI9K1_001704 [Arcticibacterium sp.]|jgi:hypothetical protein